MIRWKVRDRKIEGERPEWDPEMRKKMRRVFSGEEGEEVLSFILADLGFFDPTTDERGNLLHGEDAIRAQARRDYARRLLEQLGVFHEGNVFELVKKLMQLPVWEKKAQ